MEVEAKKKKTLDATIRACRQTMVVSAHWVAEQMGVNGYKWNASFDNRKSITS